MAKPKVFAAFDYSEDVPYKHLLQAWGANTDFDFELYSHGHDLRIDSNAVSVAKFALTERMQTAANILVPVGTKSYASQWIDWEVDRAKQSDLPLQLAAVKISEENFAPMGFLDIGAAWACSFTRDLIVEALKDTGGNY